MMKVEMRMLAGLLLALLGLAADARAQAAEAPKARLSSPYGIPGQVPTEEVWTRFLAGSDLVKATTAMKVTNRLFDAEGNLDPKACAEQQAAVREALAEIPVSAGLWLYGSRCAELSGDRVLAEQSEAVLAVLLEHALGGRRLARLDRPIRVLGENDIYAILELTGEQVLHQFYQVPVQGRYMRLMVGLYNPETKRESPLYFDFLDTFIQLADDQPELAYPEGRQQFALSLLEGMAGSAPADLARDFWAALRLRDRAARVKGMLALREKGGDYPFWLGTMCILVTDLGCAEQGVEMMLPFAEEKHADAFLALAAAYADGRGVERDEAAARDMLAAANAEVGAPNAEIALQYTLRTVHNDPKLHPLVADNLRAAAKAGDPLASLVVALSLGDWEGSVPAEALPLLETASRAGLAVATGMIGRHYLEGGQPAKGLPLLEQAALAGDTAAASTLGTNYALGKHVERDWTKAREWLTQSAQDGNTRAMRLLAMDYQREPGPENALRVDRWLTSATVLGDLTAALELGALPRPRARGRARAAPARAAAVRCADPGERLRRGAGVAGRLVPHREERGARAGKGRAAAARGRRAQSRRCAGHVRGLRASGPPARRGHGTGQGLARGWHRRRRGRDRHPLRQQPALRPAGTPRCAARAVRAGPLVGTGAGGERAQRAGLGALHQPRRGDLQRRRIRPARPAAGGRQGHRRPPRLARHRGRLPRRRGPVRTGHRSAARRAGSSRKGLRRGQPDGRRPAQAAGALPRRRTRGGVAAGNGELIAGCPRTGSASAWQGWTCGFHSLWLAPRASAGVRSLEAAAAEAHASKASMA